jgi:hypothetical protein
MLGGISSCESYFQGSFQSLLEYVEKEFIAKKNLRYLPYYPAATAQQSPRVPVVNGPLWDLQQLGCLIHGQYGGGNLPTQVESERAFVISFGESLRLSSVIAMGMSLFSRMIKPKSGSVGILSRFAA